MTNTSHIPTVNDIDALLPQTQCGLCGHPDGCLPYAQGILEGEEANKCVPGGQPVADDIATLLGREKRTAMPSKWALQSDGRPQEVRAVIIEDDCIGCTKCIVACPVDAIIGRGKKMHTVFTDLCTGCELCLPPCPVDCIELVPIDRQLTPQARITEQNQLRERYQAHLTRLTDKLTANDNQAPIVNAKQARITQKNIQVDSISSHDAKKTIAMAKLRTQIKRLKKQIHLAQTTHLENQQLQLSALEAQLTELENQ